MTRRGLLLLPLLWALILASAAASVNAAPLSVQEWLNQVNAVAGRLDAEADALSKGAHQRTVNARLNSLLDRLRLPTEVSTAPGEVVSVDNEWARLALLSATASTSPHAQAERLRQLAQRFRLLGQLAQPSSKRRFAGDPRALAAKILSDPEFVGRKAGPFNRLADIAARLLAELASLIFGGLISVASGRAATLALLILLAVAVAFAIWIVVRHLTPRRRRRFPGPTPEQHPLPPDAATALRRALAAVEAGDVKESLRLFYLALLLALASSRIFDFSPARTNWEYVRLSAGTPHADMLARATSLFESKYFGRQPCSPQELGMLREWAEGLLEEGI
jgi:hypothetical protein